MVARKEADPNKRLTVESLRYYVPIFQEADDSYEALVKRIENEPELKAQTTSAWQLRELVLDRLMKLAEPLIIREINNVIAKSHLRGSDDSIYNQLFYAGRAGALKGLRHFDVDRLDSSATNYLLQWFTAYTKKELLTLEAAPFGIPPSRFQTYKKISAVRKKLTENFGRYAENQEVLDYLHSGAADVKSMNGRVGSSEKRYTSNRKITFELVKEQEYFERNLIAQNLVDPLDKSVSELVFGEVSTQIFSETLFGAFVAKENLTLDAVTAIKHELHADLSAEESARLMELSAPALRKLNSQWRLLLRDSKGPFYRFLLSVKDNGFDEFDVSATIRSIKDGAEVITTSQWLPLYRSQEGS